MRLCLLNLYIEIPGAYLPRLNHPSYENNTFYAKRRQCGRIRNNDHFIRAFYSLPAAQKLDRAAT